MGTGFETKRFFITGGTGFLGGAVQAALRARGVTEIITPSSREVDFRDAAAAQAAIEAAEPDIVLHLAARVGGIGANRVCRQFFSVKTPRRFHQWPIP